MSDLVFDLPKEQSSIIKVIGVGGGGSNAVSHMHQQGIKDVNFVICNTDAQSMELSGVPNKIQLGPHLKEGLGAGSNPEVGREATQESLEDIETILSSNTKMVFITAGMGGGTGTGGAPVIAKIAKEMGILTVGIVTTPFKFEGPKRIKQAEEGIAAMKEAVDTLLIISNDKLREMHGNLKLSDAFAQADTTLTTAAKGIAEIITVPGTVNVDFEDVSTVMRNSGVAIMGSASASGEDRAIRVVEEALNSPLLNDSNIRGAQQILLNITSGSEEATMDEISEITDYVQSAAGNLTNLIWGHCTAEHLEDSLSVTVIATGFQGGSYTDPLNEPAEKVVHNLNDEKKEEPATETHSWSSQAETTTPEPAPEQEATPPIEATEEGPPVTAETRVEEEQKEEESNWEETTDKGTEEQSYVFDLTESDAPSEPTPEEEPEVAPQGLWSQDPPPAAPEEQPRDSMEPTLIERKELNELPETETEEQDDRVRTLKGLSMQLKNPTAVNDLEQEPAYLRRKVELEDQPHSSQSNVSKYTLEQDEDGRPELRENNSFLHDNVD
jgi:cell division protein FtsZ